MSAAEHLQEAIDVGCTRDDHDHVGDHRTEVLTEATALAEAVIAGPPVEDEHLAFWWRDGVRTYRDELLKLAGKDTGDATQAPAGESTQPAPDLHSIVLNALSAGQGPLLPLPVSTVRILAARVVDAVAPLVPYRRVWDSSFPPGGSVCSICGDPVESEPCPDHAPATGDLTPLAVRWDRTVIHPQANPTEPTIVCCIAADTGQPVALFLDDEHREALGLQLVDPDGDDEVYADVPDDEPDARVQASVGKLRRILAGGGAAGAGDQA